MSYYVYDDKKIYYYETGSGHPLLLLHGNTASSKMFAQIAEEYSKSFKVILIDFLGHGLSDRLEIFPSDLWFYEAQQVIAFLRFKHYTDVNIIGSSGGAIVALNVALEAPVLVKKVIADSFEGERANETFTKNLLKDRKNAKNDPNAQGNSFVIFFISSINSAKYIPPLSCEFGYLPFAADPKIYKKGRA